VALGDYAKTTWVNGGPPGISAGRLNNIENKTEELDTAVKTHNELIDAHLAETASQETAGHVKVDGDTITISDGVISSNSLEVIKEFVVKSSESVTADDVVAFVNGGLKTAKTTIGTTITAGTPVVFESANSTQISATTLSSDKVLVAYSDYGNSSYGTSVVLSISGTTITAGTPVVFESASSYYISATTLSSDKVLVAYRDNGNSNYGTAVVLSISGTTITAGTPVVFESANSIYISATTLSSDKVLVAYSDYGNSNYGTAVVLSMPLSIDKEIIGIAKETKSAGENCKVSLGPITTGLSGLTAGNIYYMDTDGTLCTTKKYAKIGVAVSTTELRQTIQEL